MGVIYELVHLDRKERYDLDKFGNRGLSHVFPLEPFTLAAQFGTVDRLADILVHECISENYEEHLRDVFAPDVWEWAGPDGHLQCVCDAADNDIPGFYDMPETGSRMFPQQEGYALLRAYQRWRIASQPYHTWDVDRRLINYAVSLDAEHAQKIASSRLRASHG